MKNVGKLSLDSDLKSLPMGALVVNGYRLGEEWVFRKTLSGKWMLYDIEAEDLSPHLKITSRHPEWGAEDGFNSLNLPVYLLSRLGRREEALPELSAWRKHKLDWMGE